MRILLISSNSCRTPYPVYPLGLGMIASALGRAGHDVHQFDFLESGESLEALEAALGQIDPGLVGLSIRNIDNVNLLNEQRYLDVAASVVRTIRGTSEAPVVLGGSGFSLMPEAILGLTGAEYGVVGEGEESIVDLARRLEDQSPPPEPCIRASRKIDGSAIPSALFDSNLLRYYRARGTIVPVQTKRGCDFQCVYCAYPVLEGTRVRHRPPREVVDELFSLSENEGVEHVFFTDSVFNDRSHGYRDLLMEMRRRDLKIRWTAFFAPRDLDDETVALMAETGLVSAEIGADAACDATLAGMGKSFRWNDVVETSGLFSRHRVGQAHYVMFGGPGENQDTVREGIENLRRLQDSACFIYMGIRILPETPLHRLAICEGLVGPDQSLVDSVYYLSPGLDRTWLEQALRDGFAGVRHCVFPPDSFDRGLSVLYRLGSPGFRLTP